jgi:hypothetical protein
MFELISIANLAVRFLAELFAKQKEGPPYNGPSFVRPAWVLTRG